MQMDEKLSHRANQVGQILTSAGDCPPWWSCSLGNSWHSGLGTLVWTMYVQYVHPTPDLALGEGKEGWDPDSHVAEHHLGVLTLRSGSKAEHRFMLTVGWTVHEAES